MRNEKNSRARKLGLERLDDRLVLSANPLTFPLAAELGPNAIGQDHGERTTFRRLDVATSSDDVVDAATKFLGDYYSDLGLPSDVNENLRLFEVKHGLASSHVRFEQTYEGIKVHDRFVSVHFGPEQNVQTVHNAYATFNAMDASDLQIISLNDAISAAEKAADVEVTFAEPHHELVWNVDKYGDGELAWDVTVFGHAPSLGDFHTIVDADSGQVVWQENRMAFATGQGNVFEPNPYQTRGDGSGLNDNNDANSTALSAEMVNVTLERLDDGTGLIRGEWVDLSSLNSPDLPDIDANESDRIYEYTRNDARFEQVVIYHSVDQIQEYFHQLGFDDDSGTANGIRDFPTLANAHWFTADQSFYSLGNDGIHFGDGGVDDGEDADIIAHEYGHAVQHDQNGMWGGGEMGAMGEGFGDYLAASFYAGDGDAAFQSAHAAAVGEWDATSYSGDSPPNLRRVDGNKSYPGDLVNQVHADGEIWSAALWDIRADIGAELTDQLVLESHFALPGGAIMADGANAIIDATQNVDGAAAFTESIIFWFEERGIIGGTLEDDHGNNSSDATSIVAPSTVNGVIELANDVDYFSFDLVAGEEYELSTSLFSLSDSTLTLFDTDGTTQIAFDDDGGAGLASRIDFAPTENGVYFARVDNFSNELGSYSFTIEGEGGGGGGDDHGNDANSATAIELNSLTDGAIELETDNDWFSFAIPEGGSIIASTLLLDLTDTTLTLYDTDGTTELAFNDDIDFNGGNLASQINWTAPSAGRYYLEVDNFSNQVGLYQLELTSDVVIDDPGGDFNEDGEYDCEDIDSLVGEIVAGNASSTFDLTGDELVDADDIEAWLLEAGEVNLGAGLTYLQGDANLDGVVDVTDFNVWNGNKFTSTGAWCLADFTANGVTDVSDFNVWNTHKFTSSFPAPVSVTSGRPVAASSMVAQGDSNVIEEPSVSESSVVSPNNVRSSRFDRLHQNRLRRDAEQVKHETAIERVFSVWNS